MRVSAKADYAVRAAIELAASDGERPRQEARDRREPEDPAEVPGEHPLRAPQRRADREPAGSRGRLLADEAGVGDHRRRRDARGGGPTRERSIEPGRRSSSTTGKAEPLQKVWVALRQSIRDVLEGDDAGAPRRGRAPRAGHVRARDSGRLVEPVGTGRAAGPHQRRRASAETTNRRSRPSWRRATRARTAARSGRTPRGPATPGEGERRRERVALRARNHDRDRDRPLKGPVRKKVKKRLQKPGEAGAPDRRRHDDEVGIRHQCEPVVDRAIVGPLAQLDQLPVRVRLVTPHDLARKAHRNRGRQRGGG